MSIKQQIHFLTIVHQSDHCLPSLLRNIESLALDSCIQICIWILYNGTSNLYKYRDTITSNTRHNIYIINSITNLGYSGGNNLLLSHVLSASKDTEDTAAILLNPDILVTDELLAALLHGIYNLNSFAVSPSETSSVDNYTQVDLVNSSRKKLLSTSYLGFPSSSIVRSKHEYIQSYLLTGACLAVNLTQLRKHNIFLDSRLFMYLEEVDLVIQASKHNLLTYVISTITIEHNKDESNYNPRKIYYCTRNSLIILRSLPLQLLPFFIIGRFVIPFFRLGVMYVVYWKPSCIAASIIGFWDGLLYRNGIKQIYHGSND